MMVTTRLRPRPQLHKEVAEILSEKIVSGELRENSFLPTERELCQSLGVSRTVVREAVKVLESRGLVQIKRGFGTIVTEPHHDQVSRSLGVLLRRKGYLVNQLVEVRELLEVGMAGFAAQRRTTENLAAMEKCLEIMRERPDHPEGYVGADVGFHQEIAQATQNPTFLVLLEPIGDLLRQSRIVSFSGLETTLMRIKEHEEIYTMIKRQDVEGARSAMSAHLKGTLTDLEKHQERLEGISRREAPLRSS